MYICSFFVRAEVHHPVDVTTSRKLSVSAATIFLSRGLKPSHIECEACVHSLPMTPVNDWCYTGSLEYTLFVRSGPGVVHMLAEEFILQNYKISCAYFGMLFLFFLFFFFKFQTCARHFHGRVSFLCSSLFVYLSHCVQSFIAVYCSCT
jgi:hypothetical protein